MQHLEIECEKVLEYGEEELEHGERAIKRNLLHSPQDLLFTSPVFTPSYFGKNEVDQLSDASHQRKINRHKIELTMILKIAVILSSSSDNKVAENTGILNMNH